MARCVVRIEAADTRDDRGGFATQPAAKLAPCWLHSCAFVATMATMTPTCGLTTDCPRQYTFDDIRRSAARWDPRSSRLHRLAEAAARRSCQRGDASASGSYCIGSPSPPQSSRRLRNEVAVALPNNQSYVLPLARYVPADDVVVEVLRSLLVDAQGRPSASLLDVGAGVGQYGRKLLSLTPGIDYRGCDGAGDVRAATGGFVSWCDLAERFDVPRADWVLCLEAGEHVPARHEGTVLRNLHAHNRRGIILSWAVLGQQGPGHLNNHANGHVVSALDALGYDLDSRLTAALRTGWDGKLNRSAARDWRQLMAVRRAKEGAIGVELRWTFKWFARSIMAFVRRTPLPPDPAYGAAAAAAPRRNKVMKR